MAGATRLDGPGAEALFLLALFDGGVETPPRQRQDTRLPAPAETLPSSYFLRAASTRGMPRRSLVIAMFVHSSPNNDRARAAML